MTGHAGARGLLAFEVPPANTAAGTVNGTGVDTQGWDRVRFHMVLGVVGNGGTVDMRVVGSANANFSGAVNITNAALTQIPNGVANVTQTIDVYRPTNRYVRVVVVVGTNNANLAVLSERFRGSGNVPPTQVTNSQYVSVSEN